MLNLHVLNCFGESRYSSIFHYFYSSIFHDFYSSIFHDFSTLRWSRLLKTVLEETRIRLFNKDNTIAADALAPSVTRASAAMSWPSSHGEFRLQSVTEGPKQLISAREALQFIVPIVCGCLCLWRIHPISVFFHNTVIGNVERARMKLHYHGNPLTGHYITWVYDMLLCIHRLSCSKTWHFLVGCLHGSSCSMAHRGGWSFLFM